MDDHVKHLFQESGPAATIQQLLEIYGITGFQQSSFSSRSLQYGPESSAKIGAKLLALKSLGDTSWKTSGPSNGSAYDVTYSFKAGNRLYRVFQKHVKDDDSILYITW